MDLREERIEEPIGEKLMNQIKKYPMLSIGTAGLVAVCGIGAYRFKRTTLPTSLYIVQLRVTAQSAVIGCLAIGMVYNMLQKFVFTNDEKKEP